MKTFETKTGMVKAYLHEGKIITTWDAITLFGATRLSAIIYELRHRHGMDIASRVVYGDHGTHYTEYWLEENDNAVTA